MDEQINENQTLSLGAIIGIGSLCMSFGANAVAVKISLAGMGPFTAAAFRFSIATVAIIFWALITHRPLKLRRDQTGKMMVVSILFILQLGLFYLGLSKTNASRGTLLANLQPFLVLVLAHFFIPGDRMTSKKIIGIILGFTGVVCMIFEETGVTEDIMTGDLTVLAAVIMWALNAVYTKRIIGEFRSFHLVLYPVLFSVPVFFLAAIIWDRPPALQIDFNVIVSILYQGLVTASFGYVAWNVMLRKYGAVSMNSFMFLLPVTGVSLGGLILGETVNTGNIILALFLITSGILIVNARPKLQA